MRNKKYILRGEAATIRAGKKFSKALKAGDVVLLSGNLGAGKTTFAKGIAKGLKIKERILSPTFTIMNEYYKKDITLRHFDCYRLKNGLEAENAGIAEFIGLKSGISVIEWHENIKDIINYDNAIKVSLTYEGENKRILAIE